MLKFYRNVLAAGVVALGLAACGDNVTVSNPPPATPLVHSVTVVPTSLTVNLGQPGVTFVASVIADSGISSAVSWSSTNPLVATVSAAGLITWPTGATAGQTTIIATSVGDPTKTGAGSLVVQALPSNFISFSVNPNNATIAVGGVLQPTPIVTLSAGAPAATIAWTTSNALIASVNASTGQITGVANGTAIVTATATSGTQTATATVGLTVGGGPVGVISFSLTPSATTLFATQTQDVIAVLNAPGQTYPVTFTSSAPTIASVGAGSSVTCPTGSPTGAVCTKATITALAQGSAVISASIGTGATVTSVASVITVAQGVSISINSITAGATAGTVVGCAGITGAPVVLTNVNCQIDVSMNLSAGVQPLDSLVVRMKQPSGFKTLAKQIYGNTIPSSGIVTVSINTANFVKVPTTTTVINGVSYVPGTVAVDLFNGPTTLQTQVYPHLGAGGIVFNCQVGATDATCAIVNSLVMNNADGWTADIQKCTAGTGVIAVAAPVCPAAAPAAVPPTGGFATDVGGAAVNAGTTYWGGPTGSGQTTAEIYAVIYNDNPGFPSGSALNRCSNLLGNNTGCISTVTWSLGPPVANTAPNNAATIPSTLLTTPAVGLWCAPATQTTLPFRQTFGTGTGATNACAGYENVNAIRDNIIITASIDGQNNPFALVGTLTGTAPIAGPANPNFILIPSTVVTASTPDSGRFDYKAPATVTTPTVVGAENFNWVNANFFFTPGGVLETDLGVGPAPASFLVFASASGGSTTTFPTLVTNGSQLPETNQNCVGVGCDGFNLRATAEDRLGNTNNSAVSTAFGVDKTAPQLRISTVAPPSSFASAYTGGGAATLLDSTSYNAFEGIYGANVVTPGAQTLFLAAAAGTNDSLRVEALDGRSGVSRFVQFTNDFKQGGATGATNTVFSTTTTPAAGIPGAATIDGWLTSMALHVTNGRVVGAPPVIPGYFTTTEYVIDRAGNVSGCPAVGTVAVPIVISGSFCGGAVAGSIAPSTTIGTNPAVSGGGSANLFARRTLAIDPAQPLVTGVSPNNNYTGNSPQSFALGSQDDLEVIDARLRVQYPNLTIGDNAGTFGASQGLVWSYSLSNTFLGSAGSPNGNTCNGPTSAAPTAGSCGYGYFLPIGLKFDSSIINPIVTGLGGTPVMTLDQFTLNVQETCTTATGVGSPATGPTTAAQCGTATAIAAGDPIPTTGAGSIALAKPTNVGVQTRDVFGSWIFNTVAGPAFGVSAEFVSPILPATVAASGGYSVTYYNAGALTSCPQGGAVALINTVSCVSTGVNFRQDGGSASTRNFRSTESLSTTLPIFTRVDLFGLNAAGEWVFIQRCLVPAVISPNTGAQGCTGGTVTGTDNGNERYWVYSFTTIPTTGFTFFRAIGVNAAGFGLASTRQP